MLTLIQCPFHPHVTVVACKRPWSFCQKCMWQVTTKRAYTLDSVKLEWADYAVWASCGSLSGKPVHMQLVRNVQPQLSQLAELLGTDPGFKSGISVRELISTLKKKMQVGIDSSKISQNPHMWGKSHQHHHCYRNRFVVLGCVLSVSTYHCEHALFNVGIFMHRNMYIFIHLFIV